MKNQGIHLYFPLPSLCSFQLSDAREALVISLKRATYLSFSGKPFKKTDRVCVRDPVMPITINGVPVPYELVACVEHIGNSVHCGHYVAHVKTPSGQFFKVDDSRPICKSKMEEIESSTIFLLREAQTVDD